MVIRKWSSTIIGAPPYLHAKRSNLCPPICPPYWVTPCPYCSWFPANEQNKKLSAESEVMILLFSPVPPSSSPATRIPCRSAEITLWSADSCSLCSQTLLRGETTSVWVSSRISSLSVSFQLYIQRIALGTLSITISLIRIHYPSLWPLIPLMFTY
jgi:hypothetical protein